MKQIALFGVLATLVACSSVTVTNDWDRDVDFSAFRTFAFLEDTDPRVNRFVEQRIRSAIVAELTARGLEAKDTPMTADLVVGYQAATEERTSYSTVYSGWGMSSHRLRSSHARLGASMGTSRTTQHRFTVGTLVVAMFESQTKELVWEGSVSDTVSPSSGPETSEQQINEAVRKIFENFPPPVATKSEANG